MKSKLTKFLNFSLLIFFVIDIANAQQVSDLFPETLGAKAFLEDLLVRRYRQELSTIVDPLHIQLGARLELLRIQSKPIDQKKEIQNPSEIQPISDLMLGTLDPEDILKSYSSPSENLIAKQFLEDYRIKNVAISVGIKETLPESTKKMVEDWLNDRIKKEFGKIGKGTVSIIRAPLEPKAPTETPKLPVDWLNQFQNLAGQIVLAIAFLIGIILC